MAEKTGRERRRLAQRRKTLTGKEGDWRSAPKIRTWKENDAAAGIRRE
ncbi:MAG: hypothetical protein ACLU9Q_03000 [Marvinbryantia sp.]|nr:hypothetical protein [uncultured Marvinbryantia sp.]